MSATMVSHIKITDENRTYYTERYDLSALHPFDAAKVILEQALFYRYLLLTTGYAEVGILKDFQDKILQDVNGMSNQPTLANEDLQTMYEMILTTVRAAVSDEYRSTRMRTGVLKPVDYFVIFNTPLQQKYIHREYVPTITEDFVTQILALDYGWYDQEKYRNSILHEAAIYLPSVDTNQIYHPEMSSAENKDFRMVISLTPKAITSVNLHAEDIVNDQSDISWLKHFNMSQYNLDDLVGILANFSIDRTKYHMTDVKYPNIRVSDVCYDLVTGSQYSTAPSAGNGTEQGGRNLDYVFETFKELLKKGYIRPIKDLGLFGELLTAMGASQDLINYFTKPVARITAQEAYAFRTSLLGTFMRDRIMPGMEAVDEDMPEANMEFEEQAEQNAAAEGGDTDTTGGENPSDSNGEVSTPEGADTQPDETSEPKEKPHIDPDRMLLELANPNETMTDYLYREMVARRISAILKNPPQNARPNDILMLKRWRARWLYLVNIPCLRDFLTRISLRLSDV